jgi:hypothetical protein
LIRIGQFWKRFYKWFSSPFVNKKEHKIIQELYNSPLISSFNSGKTHNKPSYISAESFAKSLLFLLKKPFEENTQTDTENTTETNKSPVNTDKTTTPNSPIDNIKKNLNNPNHPLFKDDCKKLQELLHYFWEEVPGESDKAKVERFNKNLESWYNETMDRAAGWYKKNTTVYLLLVGFVLANAFQLNTIKVAQKLYNSTETQEEILALVPLYKNASASNDSLNYKQLISRKDSIIQHIEASNNVLIPDVQFPDSIAVTNILKSVPKENNYYQTANVFAHYTIPKTLDPKAVQANYTLEPTYTDSNKKDTQYQLKLDKYSYYINNMKSNFWGYLISAIAISLGGKFWYEMLNKLVNLKNSISPGSAETTK